jgi:hypothetical protein
MNMKLAELFVTRACIRIMGDLRTCEREQADITSTVFSSGKLMAHRIAASAENGTAEAKTMRTRIVLQFPLPVDFLAVVLRLQQAAKAKHAVLQ